jgi:hypothetical protein
MQELCQILGVREMTPPCTIHAKRDGPTLARGWLSRRLGQAPARLVVTAQMRMARMGAG